MNKYKHITWIVLFLILPQLSGFARGIYPPKPKVYRFGAAEPFHRSLLVPAENTSNLIQENKLPSRGKAFILSFLLPGAGELYAGSPKMAKIFFGVEVALWATYASFRAYGHWKEEDYKRYAVAHAGVTLAGKDHQYFVDVENYPNIRAYNDAKLQQRDVAAMYPETDEWAWAWDSEKSQKRFEKLRLASDDAYSNSLFVIAGILINHIVSGIDAMRIARKAQKAENTLQLGMAGLPEGGAVLKISQKF